MDVDALFRIPVLTNYQCLVSCICNITQGSVDWAFKFCRSYIKFCRSFIAQVNVSKNTVVIRIRIYNFNIYSSCIHTLIKSIKYTVQKTIIFIYNIYQGLVDYLRRCVAGAWVKFDVPKWTYIKYMQLFNICYVKVIFAICNPFYLFKVSFYERIVQIRNETINEEALFWEFLNSRYIFQFSWNGRVKHIRINLCWWKFYIWYIDVT